MSGGASVFGLGEASPATLSGVELAGSAPGSGVGQKPLSCGVESVYRINIIYHAEEFERFDKSPKSLCDG